MVAWNTTTDVNDGQSFGGAAWQTAIDNIAQIQTALAPAVPAWTSYTPAINGAGWSLGTIGATAFGVYLDIAGMVHFHARLVFGTTGATFSASGPGVTLPLNAAEAPAGLPCRTSVDVQLIDTSTGISYRGVGDVAGITYAGLLALNGTGGPVFYQLVSNTLPFTWAASDEIRMSGWYRKA